LVVFLAGGGVGLDEFGGALVVGGGPLARRAGAGQRRLRLLEFRLQVGIIEPNQHVAGLHLLARLNVHLHDARQQLRPNAGFMHGPNRSDRRLFPPERDALDGRRRAGIGRRRSVAGNVGRYFALENSRQPQHQRDHSGRKPE
jgi:hypothetical protein